MFNLKSPQSQGTPHSAEPQMGPEITTPSPNSRPRSEPVQISLHPKSERRVYQTTEPTKSTQKARKEDQAKGTCQNRIRYASGAFHASASTDGAQRKPSNTVAAAPVSPMTVRAVPLTLADGMAERICSLSSMLVFRPQAGTPRQPRPKLRSGSLSSRSPTGHPYPVRMTCHLS